MSNIIKCELEARGIETPKWNAVKKMLYPDARDEAILVAIDYCKARDLDIMLKPVHIVTYGEKTQILPSINLYTIIAARTGQYAGKDAAVFGQEMKRTFTGQVKKDGIYTSKTIELDFPAYCSVTIYRLVKGVRVPFTATARWLESYATIGFSELPNAMWAKRPYSQLEKCAFAAALRAAFPEETGSLPTDDEAGEIAEVSKYPHTPPAVADINRQIAGQQAEEAAPEWHAWTEEQWQEWLDDIQAELTIASAEEHITAIGRRESQKIAFLKDKFPVIYNATLKSSQARRNEIKSEAA